MVNLHPTLFIYSKNCTCFVHSTSIFSTSKPKKIRIQLQHSALYRFDLQSVGCGMQLQKSFEYVMSRMSTMRLQVHKIEQKYDTYPKSKTVIYQSGKSVKLLLHKLREILSNIINHPARGFPFEY